MQSGNVQHRAALTRTTQKRGQHDDRHRPESSGQWRQALGVDWKSLTDLLALNRALGQRIECPDEKAYAIVRLAAAKLSYARRTHRRLSDDTHDRSAAQRQE
jgi:hypothetical protein